MMKVRLFSLLAGLLVALTAAPVFAQSGGGYVLEGMVTNGAGSALGGGFEIGGSVGQASAALTGGAFRQTSGFWSLPLLNLVNNGDFADPIGSVNLNWSAFGDPANAIQSQVVGGVMEFYRTPGSNQAVVLQNTGQPLPNDAALRATFQIGNSSNARKRVSVLMHDIDFSDITFCTFWIPASSPLKTYQMLTHTTKAWSQAYISIYAATADNLAAYRLDNVVVQYEPTLTLNETRCIDPNAPAAPGGANGANMVTNGTFDAPFGNGTSSWGTFGNLNAQIAGGILQLYRTAGSPAGAVLQNTSTSAAANMPLEVALQIGSLSAERRRITLLLHANTFADLQACTFWIPPNSAPQTYTIQAYTTQAWSVASVSIYPSTVATAGYFNIDNVVYRQRPGLTLTGTGCYEPGSTPAEDQAGSWSPLTAPTLLPTATPMPLLSSDGMPAEIPMFVTPSPLLPNAADEGTSSE